MRAPHVSMSSPDSQPPDPSNLSKYTPGLRQGELVPSLITLGINLLANFGGQRFQELIRFAAFLSVLVILLLLLVGLFPVLLVLLACSSPCGTKWNQVEPNLEPNATAVGNC